MYNSAIKALFALLNKYVYFMFNNNKVKFLIKYKLNHYKY